MKGSFSPTTLLIFRHGEVASGETGRFYSQEDVPLSEGGIRQANRWAALLGDRFRVSLVLTSDLSRCLVQARVLARTWGCGVYATSALREVSFGKWTGLRWDEIEKAYPGALSARMADLAGFRPPGGENLEDVRQRSWGVVKRALSEHRGKTVALVGHGGLNRVMIASAIGLSLQHVFALSQDCGCMNILDFYPDGPVVLRALNLLPEPF